MQKFSSNVIEKCFEKGDDNIITKFIDEICQFSRIIGNFFIFNFIMFNF